MLRCRFLRFIYQVLPDSRKEALRFRCTTWGRGVHLANTKHSTAPECTVLQLHWSLKLQFSEGMPSPSSHTHTWRQYNGMNSACLQLSI